MSKGAGATQEFKMQFIKYNYFKSVLICILNCKKKFRNISILSIVLEGQSYCCCCMQKDNKSFYPFKDEIYVKMIVEFLYEFGEMFSF